MRRLLINERDYRPWDEARDGRRLKLLNDGDPTASLAAVLAYIECEQQPRS